MLQGRLCKTHNFLRGLTGIKKVCKTDLPIFSLLNIS
jgi:hypothetical protein